MLNIKITGRMSYEDYVVSGEDSQFILPKRHIIAVSLTAVISIGLSISTEYFFNSEQLQHPDSAAYLAEDQSIAEQTLADSVIESSPYRENYEDYDIPSSQFSSDEDQVQLADNSEEAGTLEEVLTGESSSELPDFNEKLADLSLSENDRLTEKQEEQSSVLAENTAEPAESEQSLSQGSTTITAAEDDILTASAEKTEESADPSADMNKAVSDNSDTAADTAEQSALAEADIKEDAESGTSDTDTETKDTQLAETDTETSDIKEEQETLTASAETGKTAEEKKPSAEELLKEAAEKGLIAEGLAVRRENEGSWFCHKVESGENFSVIFSRLNLPYATLNRITRVAEKKDLFLDVGDDIFFLVSKDNVVLEMTKPYDSGEQVRFYRFSGEEDFKVSREKALAQLKDQNMITAVAGSYDMPSARIAAEERRRREEARLEAIEKQLAQNKANNINPDRPRLIIGSVRKGEDFRKAGHREGLTPSEINTISEIFRKRINLAKLKEGDTFRVLFNGIGTRALISAVHFTTKDGTAEVYVNPQDRNFYGENEYTPTAGIFRRFPLSGEIKVNSNFNPHRRHPVTGRIRPHNGVDFKASVGTPVYAPADGTVTFSGYQRAAGYYVILRHANNYSTVYMHLSKYEVKKGEKVAAGQIIARTGNTGRTTGPHLHYEVRINERPVNPLKIELPTAKHPNLAKEQREAFANNVRILKAELRNDALAVAEEKKTAEKTGSDT